MQPDVLYRVVSGNAVSTGNAGLLTSNLTRCSRCCSGGEVVGGTGGGLDQVLLHLFSKGLCETIDGPFNNSHF
jgi:hypothetical protein